MGPFTINLWERANATDQDGDLFQYIFSHSAYANRTQFAAVDAFHPNQVCIPADCTASISTFDACDYHKQSSWCRRVVSVYVRAEEEDKTSPGAPHMGMLDTLCGATSTSSIPCCCSRCKPTYS